MPSLTSRAASAARFIGIGLGRAPVAGSIALGGAVPVPVATVADDEDAARDEEAAGGEAPPDDKKPGKKAKKKTKRTSADDEDGDDVDAKEGDDDDDGEDDDDDEGERENMRQAALISDPAHRQAALIEGFDTAKARKLAAGRARERARCAMIFAHPNAAKNPEFAASLAFNTGISRTEALALMETAPAGRAGGLSGRMAQVNQPALGPGGARGGDGRKAIGATWDGLRKKAMGID